MTSRAEVTTKYAKAYSKASKKDKGRVLDQVTEVTGWSRDNARRRLVAAASRPPGAGRQVAKVCHPTSSVADTRKASRINKSRFLDKLMATTGMGRSTA